MGTREHQFGLAAASKTIGVHIHSFTAFFDLFHSSICFLATAKRLEKTGI
jgi:hypothetical protein